MFIHRNEKLRRPVIREMSGQTPRGTFNRLEFWNAVPPGHLIETLCQIANLQHTGTGFIGNAYLLRLYESIKMRLRKCRILEEVDWIAVNRQDEAHGRISLQTIHMITRYLKEAVGRKGTAEDLIKYVNFLWLRFPGPFGEV